MARPDEAAATLSNNAATVVVGGSARNLGEIVSVNLQLSRVIGYSRAQVLGQNIAMIMPPPIRAVHQGFLKRFSATGRGRGLLGKTVLTFVQTRAGPIRPVWLTLREAAPAKNSIGPRFVGMISPLSTPERQLIISGRAAQFQVYAASGNALSDLVRCVVLAPVPLAAVHALCRWLTSSRAPPRTWTACLLQTCPRCYGSPPWTLISIRA